MNECAECQYMRMFNYGKRIYYCDHEDRDNGMGKLRVEELPKENLEWCPFRNESDKNGDSDMIQMNTNTSLTDKYGNPIEIRVPRPEYVSEIFGNLK